MKISLSLLPLAALTTLAAAQLSEQATTQTVRTTECWTLFTTRSVTVGTITKTDTAIQSTTSTITSFSTPVSTVTRVPKTVYVKGTVTTTLTIVDAPETTTLTEVNTFTETATFTAAPQTNTVTAFSGVATTVQTTSTSTVLPVDGFVPAKAASTKVLQRSEKVVLGRSEKLSADEERNVFPRAAQYPRSVSCNVFDIEKVKTTTTLLAAPRTTTTGVRTITSKSGTATVSTTTTVHPAPVKTTLSTSTTTTMTAMTTPTIVVTNTVSPPAVTETVVRPYYAACGPDNQLALEAGDVWNTPAAHDFVIQNDIADAYSCCVQCLLDSTCRVSMFLPSYSFCWGFGSVEDTTCNPSTVVVTYPVINPVEDIWVLSSTNCGKVVQGEHP